MKNQRPEHILSTRMTVAAESLLGKTTIGLMEWGRDNHIRVFEAEWGVDNIGTLKYDWKVDSIDEVKQHFYGAMEVHIEEAKFFITFPQTITSARFGNGPELLWLKHFRQKGIKTRGGHKFYIFLGLFGFLIVFMLLSILFHNA